MAIADTDGGGVLAHLEELHGLSHIAAPVVGRHGPLEHLDHGPRHHHQHARSVRPAGRAWRRYRQLSLSNLSHPSRARPGQAMAEACLMSGRTSPVTEEMRGTGAWRRVSTLRSEDDWAAA